MKKILLIASCCFAVVSVIVSHQLMKTHYTPSAVGGAEGETDAKDRIKWELQRFADPATGKIPPCIHAREIAFAATLPNDGFLSQSKTSSVLGWDFRGPWNVGGRTRAFAIDVTDENVFLAGGVSGGLWRSTDGGQTWSRVTSINGHPDVIAIAQDTRTGHTNTWYYLSGEAYGTSSSGGNAFFLGNGMYKSIDGGLTWNSLASTVSGTPQSFDNNWDVAWNVVTNPADTIQSVLYAATYGRIMKSVNGGTSWTVVKGSFAGGDSYFTDVAVSHAGVVFITLSSDGPAASRGIYRSPDGITFTNILPTGFPVTYNRIVVGIDPNNENNIYFFAETPGSGRHTVDFLGNDVWTSLWKYTYLSGNGSGAGGTWTDLSANLPGNINAFNGLNTQGGYDLCIKVKPNDSNIVFIGGTNIYRSTSAFADSLNTTVVGGYAIGASLPFVAEYPGHHPDQHGLTFLPSNADVMFSNCDGGISRTVDNTATPVVWNKLNNGYITSQFYTITMDHGNTNDIIMGGLQDNGTYYTNNTNSQSAWIHSFDGDGSYCAITDGGAIYYFSKQLGRLAKTTVNGSGVVTAYRRIDPIGASGYDFINPFVLDPNNQNIMYMPAGTHLWRNDDLSGIALTNQWDTISTNWVMFPDSVSGSGEIIVSVAVSKIPSNRVYYGTNKRKLYKIDNTNTGTPSPVDITASVFPANGTQGSNISCIAVDPSNADRVLVVFSNYNVYSLFYTADAGVTWQKVAGNLEQFPSGVGVGPSCRWATIIPLSDGTVYLMGTSTGLYATDTLINNGTVWVQQGTNSIGSNVVDMMDYRSTDGLVAVATHGNGVFSTHITSVNDISTVRDLTAENKNLNIYPNPVTHTLNVTLDISSGKNLKIAIQNELGQSVRNIDAAKITPNQITVDVGDLPKGIYYVNVKDGRKIFARGFVKM